MQELLEHFERDIESIRIIPSNGGRFEVLVDGDLVYSKLSTGRHVYAGELTTIIAERR